MLLSFFPSSFLFIIAIMAVAALIFWKVIFLKNFTENIQRAYILFDINYSKLVRWGMRLWKPTVHIFDKPSISKDVFLIYLVHQIFDFDTLKNIDTWTLNNDSLNQIYLNLIWYTWFIKRSSYFDDKRSISVLIYQV